MNHQINQSFLHSVESVRKCYIGVMDIYMNPNTLTMMDLLEVMLKYPDETLKYIFIGEHIQDYGLQ